MSRRIAFAVLMTILLAGLYASMLPEHRLVKTDSAALSFVMDGGPPQTCLMNGNLVPAIDCWAALLRQERDQKEAECAAVRKQDIYAACDSDKWDANKI